MSAVHQAPPVSVRSQGQAWPLCCTLLAGLSAGAVALWALSWLSWPAWPAFGAALAAAALVYCLSNARAFALGWNGQSWSVDDHTGGVDVMLDFGAWLLLRWRGLGPGPTARVDERWVLLSAKECGPAWHGLRVALFAAGDGGSAGPVTPAAIER